MTRYISSFLYFIAIFPQAWAYESRFEIDPKQNLSVLAAQSQVAVQVYRKGDAYYSDASAVLRVDAKKIFEASLDYDRYSQMKMPYVKESHRVEAAGRDTLYTWTRMTCAGVVSEHYLEVKVEPSLGPQGIGYGMQWQLTPAKASWSYNEDSSFTRLDGSWYVQPLEDGTVYVRYFLAAAIDTSLPTFLIEGVVRNQFSSGVKELIQVLAREAAIRH